MRKLAICDDNPDDLTQILKFIDNYCKNHQISIQIDYFSDEQEFLQKITIYDIIFIDIYLKNHNGIEIIKELRQTYSDVCVVFITTSQEYAISAFQVNAIHYLIKPVSEENVATAMERCLSHFKIPTKKAITIKAIKSSIPVPIYMHNILYIEVFGKVSILHTEKSQFETYSTLNSIFEQLDASFLRVQRSFIINMNAIEGFFTDHVELKNGKSIPISRKNRKLLKTQYQEFLFQKAREK